MKPVRLRMERASEHATNLGTAIGEFMKTNPYEIVHEFDPNPVADEFPPGTAVLGSHRYRIKIQREVPDRISILAGDALKDLRSALDYVAWQLALAQSDTPPQSTAFPIFGDGTRYRTDQLRFIGGIDPATHAVFDSVQPYHAGDKAFEQPLWVLHRLANDDKHKVPHVVGSLPVAVGVDRPPGVDLFIGSTIGPFEDGDVIATVGIIGGIDPEIEPNVYATLGIAFGKDTPAQGRPLTSEVDRIGIEVDKVIRLFEPFF